MVVLLHIRCCAECSCRRTSQLLPLLHCTSQAISKEAMLVVRRAALVARRVVAKAPVAARSRFSTYTVAAIEDGDDAAWRKLLSDADFLAAVEDSEDLAAAFVKRMDRQTVEISRLGVPEGDGPEIWTYAAHLFSYEDPAVLATARVAVWPRVEIKFQAPHAIDATLSL